MNKTIRSNCFETNSSSTHSITITSKSKTKRGQYKQLVVANILYPGNLPETAAHHRIQDGYEARCSTVAEKAAVFMHHSKAFFYDDWDDTYTKDDAKVMQEFIKSSLIKYCNKSFTNIDDDFNQYYSAYSEYGDSYITDILTNNDDLAIVYSKIIEHIENVILNDDAIVIDSELPN